MTTTALWALHQGFANRDADLLARACAWTGREVVWFSSPPFSDVLPDLPTDRRVVFYGSARVTALVAGAGRWSPGVFFEPDRFSMRAQTARWGARMVNASAEIASLGEIARWAVVADAPVFARPVEDLKEFTGHVLTRRELVEWAQAVLGCSALAERTEVLVAPTQTLDIEWRAFVVERSVVTASRYREQGRAALRGDLPEEVAAFAAEAAAQYSPAPVFVLDVAAVGNELRIVEANGFNSCGLYEADAGAIVEAVSAFVESG